MPPILSDAALRCCVRRLAPGLTQADAGRIAFAPSRIPARGDVSTGAAFPGARAAGMPAAAFAALLAGQLALLPGVREARAEGAGFVNLRLLDSALDGVLPAVLALPVLGPEPLPLAMPLAAMHRGDPDFRLQHAHARCRSVLRAASLLPDHDIANRAALARAARGQFVSGPGRPLLCRLEHWLRLVELPGLPQEPGRTALFLQDLPECFDHLWKASQGHATLRLLHPDQPTRSLANLALVLATAETIRSGLALLGRGAAEELQ